MKLQFVFYQRKYSKLLKLIFLYTLRLLQEVTSSNKYAKKTRKRKRELEKTKKEIGKMGKSQKETRSKYCNLEGIMAIYDPQNFTDKLLGSLEQKKNEKFFIRFYLFIFAFCEIYEIFHFLEQCPIFDRK